MNDLRECFRRVNYLKIFGLLLRKQHELNKHFCGENYLDTNVAEKTGKPLSFHKALHSEVNELLESRNWKHWKSGNQVDFRNTVTELIDILHFILALNIIVNKKIAQNESGNNTYNIEQVLVDSSISMNECFHTVGETLIGKQVNEYIRNLAEDEYFNFFHAKLTYGASAVDNLLQYSLLSKSKGRLRMNLDILNNAFFDMFIYMFKYHNITPKDVVDKYLIKNTLNKFRQNNGDASNEYVKIWDKENKLEDNDVIFDYFGSNPEILKDVLSLSIEETDNLMYKHIEDLYKSYVTGE